jgi:hypothetical protein
MHRQQGRENQARASPALPGSPASSRRSRGRHQSPPSRLRRRRVPAVQHPVLLLVPLSS